jgi:RNA polymerase sigma-70 factor (ECF subfamily)
MATGDTSERAQTARGTQLSRAAGVRIGVSSLAIPADGIAAVSGHSAEPQAVVYERLSDADVMLRVKTGDDAAFDYLVAKFRHALIGFMYRMAHERAVAEELAQEVFLRVYRSRHSYHADAKFTTWLYRIATNLAVNYARDRRAQRADLAVRLDEPDAETGASLDLPDGTPTAEQAMLRRERLEAIRRHVQNLPERQRVAVIMHKYQELDYRQIALVLGLSESATKSLLFRAYETLRERLKEFV